MRYVVSLFIFITFLNIGCQKDEESKKLADYLKTYNKEIKKYKVICVVPVDGCTPCINPILAYAKNANNDFLLVMTSMFKKTVKNKIEAIGFEHSNYISDADNHAVELGLVTPVSPCYYFMEDGKIVKKYDLRKTSNPDGIIDEIDEFLSVNK